MGSSSSSNTYSTSSDAPDVPDTSETLSAASVSQASTASRSGGGLSSPTSAAQSLAAYEPVSSHKGKQEAQLSQRGRSMPRVVEYFG